MENLEYGTGVGLHSKASDSGRVNQDHRSGGKRLESTQVYLIDFPPNIRRADWNVFWEKYGIREVREWERKEEAKRRKAEQKGVW